VHVKRRGTRRIGGTPDTDGELHRFDQAQATEDVEPIQPAISASGAMSPATAVSHRSAPARFSAAPRDWPVSGSCPPPHPQWWCQRTRQRPLELPDAAGFADLGEIGATTCDEIDCRSGRC